VRGVEQRKRGSGRGSDRRVGDGKGGRGSRLEGGGGRTSIYYHYTLEEFRSEQGPVGRVEDGSMGSSVFDEFLVWKGTGGARPSAVENLGPSLALMNVYAIRQSKTRRTLRFLIFPTQREGLVTASGEGDTLDVGDRRGG
jgi:hypothetical protein